ncbi:unnamed protein product [Victoria cruziana]
MRRLIEIGPPSPLRYLIGAMIMMVGIVLPVGYMMFRNKRISSSSPTRNRLVITIVIQEISGWPGNGDSMDLTKF